MSLNVNEIRKEFPSLKEKFNGRQAIFFDSPGGTQVPKRVIDAMKDYFLRKNSNTHGVFETSIRTDSTIEEARIVASDFLNSSPDEIVFGNNMTSLTFHLSRSLSKEIKKGDEIIVTRLEHDANISPWLMLAEDTGAKIRWCEINKEDCTLEMEDLKSKINERTRIIAICYASNSVGTINDVKKVVKWGKEVGAITYVDAVQYAPHGLIDVKDLGCDFLVCSSYKFFGPHLGILYGKREHLNRWRAYKVRPVPDFSPEKWETGTQNHEGIAGFISAVEYIAELGVKYGGESKESPRRIKIIRAFEMIKDYESKLCGYLLEELSNIRNVKIYGIRSLNRCNERVPVISIRKEGKSPEEMAKALARENIFCWHGHFFAIEIQRALGLDDKGGFLRIGLVHYNTREEIKKFISCIERI